MLLNKNQVIFIYSMLARERHYIINIDFKNIHTHTQHTHAPGTHTHIAHACTQHTHAHGSPGTPGIS